MPAVSKSCVEFGFHSDRTPHRQNRDENFHTNLREGNEYFQTLNHANRSQDQQQPNEAVLENPFNPLDEPWPDLGLQYDLQQENLMSMHLIPSVIEGNVGQMQRYHK
jgi:hypothetical protein